MCKKSERSILEFGTKISFIVGILYVVVTVLIAIDPMGMYIANESVEKLVENPYINSSWRIIFAIICLLNIGFFNSFSVVCRTRDEKYTGIIQWITTLAAGAMVVAAVNWVHFVHVTRLIVEQYLRGMSFEEISGTFYFPIDSYFVWTWGVFGLYYVIMNFIALKTQSLSKKISWVGIACGIDLILMVMVYIFGITIDIGGVELNLMIVLAGLVGGIGAPIYHINYTKQIKKKFLKGTSLDGGDCGENIGLKLQSQR
ncbi:MAG: hypothetical protein BWY74_00621 [Firmicutes bacterium ADurb.Bin419]|nr:MAG: hypothetical protein BWY74_00621 [Firmicutes bacterium ADurb.Bin419]